MVDVIQPSADVRGVMLLFGLCQLFEPDICRYGTDDLPITPTLASAVIVSALVVLQELLGALVLGLDDSTAILDQRYPIAVVLVLVQQPPRARIERVNRRVVGGLLLTGVPEGPTCDDWFLHG